MRSEAVTAQLRELGVEPGCVLLVHTAFSKVRPVDGGPAGLIAALEAAIGSGGTLVMPSMADTDDEPFERSTTPCMAMGVVADTFWRLPGVARSDSPHAFAARGPLAEAITRPHPLEIPHGIASPVGRVFEAGGQVLLLGVGHDANTTVHLAENLAGVRYGQTYASAVWENGSSVLREYFEPDHCCERFALLDDWLEAEALQRRGRVGSAEARLAASKAIVDSALAQLRRNETVFLHEAGLCAECDAARV